MRSAGALYDKSVKEKGKTHGLGPPCIYTFPALLNSVAEQELSVGGLSTKALKSYLEDWPRNRGPGHFDAAHQKEMKPYDAVR